MTNELKQASIEDILQSFNNLAVKFDSLRFLSGHLDVNEIFRFTDENFQLALSNITNATSGLSQGLYHLDANVDCFISVSENGIAKLTGRHILAGAVYGPLFIQDGMKVAGITSGAAGTLYLSKVG